MKQVTKKIISIVVACFICLFSALTPIQKEIASAGQDDFIAPLFSGYLEDETKATLMSQNTVIDMSRYNGVRGVGEDVGIITAISSYVVSNTQEGSIFCIPFLGTMKDLQSLEITVNGEQPTMEVLYGDTPYYFAGEGVGYRSIIDAIELAQPTAIKDGIGKLYTFEPIGGTIEFSFQKNNEQTVIHDGISWSSQGTNGYSYKGQNSDFGKYPYWIFVTDGELINFKSNVEYTVSDISYKDYADYYLNEILTEIGEEYRPLFYSQFNRSLTGNVLDVSEVLFYYSHYVFALMKIELPVGESRVEVNSSVFALVNALYKPNVYIVRTVSPYPRNCEYSLLVKASDRLPYLLEDNIGLSEMRFTDVKQKADGYFIVCSEKDAEYLLGNKKDKRENHYDWIQLLGTALVVLTASSIIIFLRVKQSK